MNREAQQIRATAMQLALATLQHVQINEPGAVIALAADIAKFIEGERPLVETPLMKAVRDDD